MGCVHGKDRCLTQDDLDYITKHTSMTKEEIELKYEYFKQKHPNGKLSKVNYFMAKNIFASSTLKHLEMLFMI